MEDKKFRINWEERDTKVAGHGEYCLTLQEARDWIHSLNKKHPEIEHWIEQNDQQ
jgi:hypothetical protein